MYQRTQVHEYLQKAREVEKVKYDYVLTNTQAYVNSFKISLNYCKDMPYNHFSYHAELFHFLHFKHRKGNISSSAA